MQELEPVPVGQANIEEPVLEMDPEPEVSFPRLSRLGLIKFVLFAIYFGLPRVIINFQIQDSKNRRGYKFHSRTWARRCWIRFLSTCAVSFCINNN